MADETDNPIDVGDPFARRLMVQYLARRKADLASLRTALDDGRFDEIRTTGHNLSGSGGAYGLDRVSELGLGLEQAAEAHERDRIDQLINELERFIGALRLG